jgi:hypothetical protein
MFSFLILLITSLAFEISLTNSKNISNIFYNSYLNISPANLNPSLRISPTDVSYYNKESTNTF